MALSREKAEVVAIIGAGEMGSAIGRRLRESGARVITEIKGRSRESVERVRRAGLEIFDDDDAIVREAAFILSIVPPGVALEVAERFCGPLGRTTHRPVFAECNAISPATVRRIEKLLAGTDCRFVDAGIIGGPPPAGVDKSPRIYASGVHAHLLPRLGAYGLDIAVLDAPIGAASGLKLSYAGLTKGFTALGAAMVAAASRDGLAGALRDELARSQPEFLTRLERFIPPMFPKASRWIAEMEQIAEFIGAENEGGMMYTGAAHLYERLAEEFQEPAPGVRLRALEAFCKSSR
jgi:3-hydroxyisobutyrate dehydrogenase-like beta-hydroxyacid dehydrogenase